MKLDYNEIYIRLIKYLFIIFIISLIILIIPDNIDLYKRAIFIGLVTATIFAIFDYFIPVKNSK
tara:strand:+ start:6941 stop:7132 length:192 start_codon:yes stop_codon:yes gene_type:complete